MAYAIGGATPPQPQTMVGDVLSPVGAPSFPKPTTLPKVPFGLGPPGYSSTSAAANPPNLQFTYDTIGQIIPISIGHCRLGLKTIWVAGVDGSDTVGVTTPNNDLTLSSDAAKGDTALIFGHGNIPSWLVVGTQVEGASVLGAITAGTVVTDVTDDMVTISIALGVACPAGTIFGFIKPVISSGDSGIPIIGLGGGAGSTDSAGIGTPAPTITFAAALCQPIDPEEIGNITEVFDGSTQTYSLDGGGLTLPPDWTVTNQQQLATSLGNAIVYPGTEGQEPSPLIVADKGANITNAFRGLRYIIFIDYPIIGSGGSAMPRISIVWRRLTDIPRSSSNATAVTFAAGAG